MKYSNINPNPKFPDSIFSRYLKKIFLPVTTFLLKQSTNVVLKIGKTSYELLKSAIKNWYLIFIYKIFHRNFKHWKK